MQKFLKTLSVVGIESLPEWRRKVAAGETDFTDEEIDFAEKGMKAINQNFEVDKLIELYFGHITELFESIPELKAHVNPEPEILNKVRLMSVYADIGDTGELESVPMLFSDELSKGYLTVATDCVKFINEVKLPESKDG